MNKKDYQLDSSCRVEALINPIILIRHKKDTYSSNYFLALHNEGEWDLVKICTVVTTVSLKDHRWDPEFTKVVAVLLVYLQDILFRKWLRKLDSHHEQCWQIDHPKLWTNRDVIFLDFQSSSLFFRTSVSLAKNLNTIWFALRP